MGFPIHGVFGPDELTLPSPQEQSYAEKRSINSQHMFLTVLRRAKKYLNNTSLKPFTNQPPYNCESQGWVGS